MTPDPDTRAERIGALYERLSATLPSEDWARVAELARSLAALYGDGLARVVELLRERHDDAALEAIAADPLVASLLLAHDLHPTERAPAELAPATPARAAGPVPVSVLGTNGRRLVP